MKKRTTDTERILDEVLERYQNSHGHTGVDIERTEAGVKGTLSDNVLTLSELQYTETGDGPWKLYLYNDDGFHGRAKWFRLGEMKYPNEEITPAEAKEKADANHAIGREVRITNGGDMLVYHSVDGAVAYGENFWKEIGL